MERNILSACWGGPQTPGTAQKRLAEHHAGRGGCRSRWSLSLRGIAKAGGRVQGRDKRACARPGHGPRPLLLAGQGVVKPDAALPPLFLSLVSRGLRRLVEQGVHVGLDGLELLGLLAQPGEVGVGGFLVRQQPGVLLVQRLDGGELADPLGVKGPLGGLVQQQLALVRRPELFLEAALAIGGVDLAGLGVVDDVCFEGGDLGHPALQGLDFGGGGVKGGGGLRRLLRQGPILGDAVLGEEVEGAGRLLEIVDGGPAGVPGPLALGQPRLDVDEQVDPLRPGLEDGPLAAGTLFPGPAHAGAQGLLGVVGPQGLGAGETLLVGGAELEELAARLHLVPRRPHGGQEVLEGGSAGEGGVDGLPQQGLPAPALFLGVPLGVVLALPGGLLDDGQAALPAQLVADLPQGGHGVLVVVELAGAVQGGAVDFDVVVDVPLVDVGSDDELMLPAGERQGNLAAQLVGLFGGDFAGEKGLDDAVGDHVLLPGAGAPGDCLVDLLGDKELLGRRGLGALVGAGVLAAVGFLRVEGVVAAVLEKGRDALLAVGTAHLQLGDGHLRALLSVNRKGAAALWWGPPRRWLWVGVRWI